MEHYIGYIIAYGVLVTVAVIYLWVRNRQQDASITTVKTELSEHKQKFTEFQEYIRTALDGTAIDDIQRNREEAQKDRDAIAELLTDSQELKKQIDTLVTYCLVKVEELKKTWLVKLLDRLKAAIKLANENNKYLLENLAKLTDMAEDAKEIADSMRSYVLKNANKIDDLIEEQDDLENEIDSESWTNFYQGRDIRALQTQLAELQQEVQRLNNGPSSGQ